MSGDTFESEMRSTAGGDAPKRSLSERLRAVHASASAPAQAAPSVDKGGRRPGSKVVIGPDGKKRVVPAEKMQEVAAEVSGGDVLSAKNVKHLLNPICSTIEQAAGIKITDEERESGSELHASVMKNHSPAWMKEYADVALCLGWWAGIGMKAAMAIQAKNATTQGVIDPNAAPQNQEPQAPASPDGKIVGKPGGFLSKVS